MPTPQSGILPDANQNALFLLFRRRIGRRANPKLKAMLAGLPKRVAQLASQDPARGAASVSAYPRRGPSGADDGCRCAAASASRTLRFPA